MLLKFSVANYRSFKKEAVLDFKACAIKEQAENTFPARLASQPVYLLKAIVALGANASGKSNLLKAFALMQYWVGHSLNVPADEKKYRAEPYLLSTETENEASKFDCTFLIANVVYRYGFELHQTRIVSEWLYFTTKRKEDVLFARKADKFCFSKRFQTDEKNKLTILTEVTRPDTLFLSVLAQFNIDFACQISQWFASAALCAQSGQAQALDYTLSMMTNRKFRMLFNEVLEKSDLGFTEMERIKKPVKTVLNDSSHQPVNVNHLKYNNKNKPVEMISFDLGFEESSGTQKLIALLGPIVNALLEGGVVWIDEFDSRIHPYLSAMLMAMFNSAQYNSKGAQLVAVCYNQQILKKLRRDQIVFLNKDPFGASSISVLHNLNAHVRSNAMFDKEYMQGLYGGVPKISPVDV